MNATTASTPGPWHVIDSYRNASDHYKQTHPRDILILATDTTLASICEVASIPPSAPPPIHDRELANAALIAAAPQMFDLLRRMHDRLVDGRALPEWAEAWAEEIEAVIATAEGVRS
jgi:hypothetical protein